MRRVRRHIIDYFQDSNFVYIINTHECLEHINGNSLFPLVPKIAHANIIGKCNPDSLDGRIGFIKPNISKLESDLKNTGDEEKQDKIKGQIEYLEAMRNDFFKAAIPPDITFTNEMSLDLGDLTINLSYLGEGAHGNSCIAIHIPEEKTLFTGSAFTLPPVIHETGEWIQAIAIEKWIANLEKFINDSNVVNIIPSHIKYYTKSDLVEVRDYYKLITEKIKKDIKKGVTYEKTLEDLTYELIIREFEMFSDDQKDKERHMSNVRNLWNYFKLQ